MAKTDYEVVWAGRGPLTPDCPQELYQLQDASKRTMVSLGLVRYGEDGDVVSQDAVVDYEAYYLVPGWKKHQRGKRKESRAVIKTTEQYAGRRNKQPARGQLSNEAVRRIRRAYANGEGSFKLLGERFGVSRALVSQIIHRDTYMDVV